jgi:hypothetical protein
VTPTEAGFDGAKGFKMPHHGENYRIHLKRGKQPPGNYSEHDFGEQLIWYYPDDQPARLLWCNAEQQWFELTFNPIDKL